MIEDLEKNLKKDKDFEEFEDRSRNIRAKNAVNRFLKSYFNVFVLVFILLFLYLSFSFLIKPKFDEVTYSFSDIMEERELEFVDMYEDLRYRRAVISEFKKIKEEDKYKIKRMIPEEYSRDDLFVEIAYFLMKNDFTVSSIEVSDPRTLSSSQEGRDSLGRRTVDEVEEPKSYDMHLSALPDSVSSWLTKIVLDDMSYAGLKRLLVLLERNLKLIDVFSVSFEPRTGSVELETFSYYYKNN
jgi:hypothetical protein